MAEKQILIICGEASGDLHAGELAKAILALDPTIKISGVGGQHLRREGAQIFCDIKELSVLGFFDVLKKLSHFFALKKLVLDKISEKKPGLIILVDFSGFNLRLAKAINKRIPIFYYISPQVWASRPGRIQTIKKYINKMLVFFKFEEELYKKYGMDAVCVGHPLLDIVRACAESKSSGAKTTLALLPGSRQQEIKNILPIMLEAAKLISEQLQNTQFVIAKSANVDSRVYDEITKNFNLNIKIIEGKTYDCLDMADFAFVCSGTATLETAIMQKPFVVIYKMGLLNYLLYRPQVKIPYIGMVNIVADRLIVPEFIQFKAKPQAIAREVLKILRNPSLIAEMKQNLLGVKASLGSPGACSRAAGIIIDFLSK